MECLALKDLTSPTKSSSVEPDEESEQKENVKVEWRRSPESAVPALLISRKGPNSDPTHITPIKQTVLAEPWTPTANLKVLISAASPDIRDREMKKGLFRPIENDKDKPASPVALMEETEVGDVKVVFEEDDAEKKPSRKQKSLGLLCQKFLALYPDYPPAHSPIWISLDEVATSLGVERRRIYDIVNVLESLTIVGRIAKNSYTWYGRQRLLTTLQELQRRGREQGYHLQMDLTPGARKAGQGQEEDGGEGDTGSAGSNRKDKSLRIMSQKFVMLFLVSKTQTVTLDAAAKVLIEESLDCSSHSKYKTKVRRLYDIANVLTSLGLIKKVHVREDKGNKPAFKWLGPVEFSHSENTVHVAAASQRKPEASVNGHDVRQVKTAGHAFFSITPTSAAASQSLDSAPSSPRCHRTGLINQAEMSGGVGGGHACEINTEHLNASSNIQQLIQSSRRSQAPPTVLPEHLLISPPHCLAYLPSLTQPSVVMLYRSAKSECGEKRKQRMEESEESEKKKMKSVLEESEKTGAEPQPDAAEWSQIRNTETSPGVSDQKNGSESQGGDSSDHAQPSHYLYVPNNAGLNGLNFLIPAGQSGAGVTLPSSSVPTMALPYVLVPSATLPPPTLLTSGVQQQGPDGPANLGFSLPAVMTPAHFMMRVTPYSMTAVPEIIGSLPPSPVVNAGSPSSTPQQTTSIKTPIPLTPHTPKETAASFFQTPGSLEGSISDAAATRKRGSAQRRLDVSRPAGVDRKGNTQV